MHEWNKDFIFNMAWFCAFMYVYKSNTFLLQRVSKQRGIHSEAQNMLMLC